MSTCENHKTVEGLQESKLRCWKKNSNGAGSLRAAWPCLFLYIYACIHPYVHSARSLHRTVTMASCLLASDRNKSKVIVQPPTLDALEKWLLALWSLVLRVSLDKIPFISIYSLCVLCCVDLSMHSAPHKRKMMMFGCPQVVIDFVYICLAKEFQSVFPNHMVLCT